MCNSRIFILFIALAMLVGCTQIPITGSGNVVTQEEPITGFDKVDISYSFDVNISQGETFSVVIRADDNLVEHLQVIKQDSTLMIGLKPNSPDMRSATLQADITMPELTRLDLSGSSHATITGFKSAQVFVVDAFGDSHLQGDIEADTVSFNLDGSSEVILTGSAQNVIIEEATGSSDCLLYTSPSPRDRS